MIAGILGRTSKFDDGGYGISPNWIIAAVMKESETIRSRIKIVETVLGKVLTGHPLQGEWASLSARIYKRAKDRNVVVHTEWAWSEEEPSLVIRVQKNGELEGWKESDFLDAFERIHALQIELHLFMKKVLAEIHAGNITSFITPDMVVR